MCRKINNIFKDFSKKNLIFFRYISIYNVRWAGLGRPNYLGWTQPPIRVGPISAQQGLGQSRPNKVSYFCLDRTWPRQQGWARISLQDWIEKKTEIRELIADINWKKLGWNKKRDRISKWQKNLQPWITWLPLCLPLPCISTTNDAVMLLHINVRLFFLSSAGEARRRRFKTAPFWINELGTVPPSATVSSAAVSCHFLFFLLSLHCTKQSPFSR